MDGDVCGKELYKELESVKGEKYLRPLLIYPYRSVIAAVRSMFSERVDIEKLMVHYKKRKIQEGHYFDIYDGAMFKDLLTSWGTPFHDLLHPLFLTLNVDWFQPFSNSVYSCGAIYLSINNFPREDRLKQENIILVGLMPGGSEANTTHIMSYLTPLVNDLIEFYEEGVEVKTLAHPNGVKFYGALLAVACDIPACRKIGGFMGHGSKFACNKCEDQFEMVNSRPDFSGAFNPTLRTRESNYKAAMRWKNASSSKEREDLEQEEGCRYSELHRLPYFDVVRQSIIDPMHNLLLGTCKRMAKNWDFEKKQLQKMQEKANLVQLPAGFESLSPKRISSNFSNFKADTWRSWVLLYSAFVLIGTINRFVKETEQ